MGLMDDKLKYIVMETRDSGEQAVVFSSQLMHKDVEFPFKRVGHPVSAGFYTVNNGVVKTYGRSEGLNLNSRPEDAALIAILLDLQSPAPQAFSCDEKLGDRCETQCSVCKKAEIKAVATH